MLQEKDIQNESAWQKKEVYEFKNTPLL